MEALIILVIIGSLMLVEFIQGGCATAIQFLANTAPADLPNTHLLTYRIGQGFLHLGLDAATLGTVQEVAW